MIGRADIEGLKRNIARNAYTATQASYACGVWGVCGGGGLGVEVVMGQEG